MAPFDPDGALLGRAAALAAAAAVVLLGGLGAVDGERSLLVGLAEVRGRLLGRLPLRHEPHQLLGRRVGEDVHLGRRLGVGARRELALLRLKGRLTIYVFAVQKAQVQGMAKWLIPRRLREYVVKILFSACSAGRRMQFFTLIHATWGKVF